MSNKEQTERVNKNEKEERKAGRIPRGRKEEIKRSWLSSGFMSRVVC